MRPLRRSAEAGFPANTSAGPTLGSDTTEGELRQVYAELGEQIGYEMRRVDASRPWMMGGALLLVAGLGAGIALGRRLP